MSTKLLRTLLTMVFVLPGLAACGGGGGGGSASAGGTGGTGISFGTVTGFGSIIVNHSRIDDSTASITLDDNPGSGDHGGLKQGMVVTVPGTFSGNTGTASTIEFRDNVEGPVCAKSTSNGITTLRVLGQTVIVDAATFGDNIANINEGDFVEVSGLPDDQERIQASFIEEKTLVSTDLVEVKGSVDTVDDGAKVLTINALNVDYSLALIDNNIPGGVPAVGQFVEVKGTAGDSTCNAAPGIDSLGAGKVELEPEGAGNIPGGVRAEIEGFITELTSNGFKIGNREVVVTGNTRFLPEDFGAGDLVVGAKVEAEGTSVNNVVTATKISFRENVKLESDVATVSGSSPTFSFTLVGLPGITITTNSATTGVAPAGHIRVRGIEGPNNTVLATRIDDRGSSTDAFLQGTVDSNLNAIVSVLGIPVDTAGIFQFEDVNDDPISRQQFLSLAQLGTLVQFKGNLGLTISWDEAELED